MLNISRTLVIYAITAVYLAINLAGASVFLCLTEDGGVKVEFASKDDCGTQGHSDGDEANFVSNTCGQCVDIPIGATYSHRASCDTRTVMRTVSASLPIFCFDLTQTTFISANSLPYFLPEQAAILQSIVLVI